MKMKFIPNAVTLKLGRQLLKAQKHSPTILFATGVVGVVATVVVASRATLKLEEVLEKTNENLAMAKELHAQDRPDYSESDYQKDLAYVYVRAFGSVAKLYAPAVFIGVASVAALTGSHYILSQRNVALTAAYAALEKGFDEYRRRVIKEVGPDKERELRYESEVAVIGEETEHGLEMKDVVRAVPNGGSVYARFFDELCPDWKRAPEYNRWFIKCQQNDASTRLKMRGHVLLNEVYESLGHPNTKAGYVVGWLYMKGGDNFIDFGVFNGDSERARAFVNGREGAILLDFNVDGVIYDKI